MNKAKYLEIVEREAATTARVLRAYPLDKGDLRPHEKLKTARELAWLVAMEAHMLTAAMQDQLRMPPEPPPPPPDSFAEIPDAFEAAWKRLRDVVAAMPESELDSGTVHFAVAPGQMGDIPKGQFLWSMLHDLIHHRGQFSVYLRMAGGKVPSIYGPSGDEPWM